MGYIVEAEFPDMEGSWPLLAFKRKWRACIFAASARKADALRGNVGRRYTVRKVT